VGDVNIFQMGSPDRRIVRQHRVSAEFSGRERHLIQYGARPLRFDCRSEAVIFFLPQSSLE